MLALAIWRESSLPGLFANTISNKTCSSSADNTFRTLRSFCSPRHLPRRVCTRSRRPRIAHNTASYQIMSTHGRNRNNLSYHQLRYIDAPRMKCVLFFFGLFWCDAGLCNVRWRHQKMIECAFWCKSMACSRRKTKKEKENGQNLVDWGCCCCQTWLPHECQCEESASGVAIVWIEVRVA